MTLEKHVDESWKERAEQEKSKPQPAKEENAQTQGPKSSPVQDPVAPDSSNSSDLSASSDSTDDEYQVDFIGYITSLGFQTMIFLGEVPHPVTQQTEKNTKQAKFLIDTLCLIREKTKGNLNQQEQNILDAAIYELQMKYVELVNQDEGK